MPFLLALFVAVPLLAEERLSVETYIPSLVDPGASFGITVSIVNLSKSEARDVVVRIGGEGISGWKNLLSTVVTSAEGAGGIRGTDRETARMYRVFTVASTAALGPGSLHDALLGAQDRCNLDCKVVFRIPPGTSPWVTIRPTLPLPAVRGALLDGAMQTAAFGDTNPDGPEIEINGALAGDGVTGAIPRPRRRPERARNRPRDTERGARSRPRTNLPQHHQRQPPPNPCFRHDRFHRSITAIGT